MRKQYPTQEEIKKVVDYDMETGIFTWKEKPITCWKPGRFQKMNCITWNAKNKGKVAGCQTERYARVDIAGRPYQAHRLAWIYVNGDEPFGELDHINRDKADNRIVNLRLANRSQNMRNYLLAKNSTSGVRGVSWNRQCFRWEAHIRVNRENIHLGIYKDFDDAVKARYDAEMKYGFTDMNPESTAYMHLQAIGA